MRLFLITAMLLFSSVDFAQRHNVYFLKDNGTYLKSRDSADYMRIVAEPDSGSVLYNVYEYYVDGSKKLIGKSSTIDPMDFDGTCIEFYKNGKKRDIINYQYGFPSGMEYDFYPNGNSYQIVNNIRATINGVFYTGQKILTENDSTGIAFVKDSNGYYKKYDETFKNIVESGLIKDGDRDKLWQGYDETLGIKFREVYNNGKLILGTSFTNGGDSINYFESRTTLPMFSNNRYAFINFLTKHIKYPEHDRILHIQGKVVLRFMVEKDGSISDIRVLKSVSPTLDAEAIRVLKESENWVPGTMYGRPIRSQYTIPLTFSLDVEN